MSDALTKRQQRAAATAEQLLGAAREVFEDRGYVATTVAAITEAANTAHGTFYLYFRNKDDVFGRVMADVIGEMYREARAPSVGDPYEALEVATRGYLNVFQANSGLWRCLIEGMHQSPAVEELWLGLRRPFVDGVVRLRPFCARRADPTGPHPRRGGPHPHRPVVPRRPREDRRSRRVTRSPILRR